MVKYITNCYLATKVAFANEIYRVSESIGLDYDHLIEIATYDERLGLSHWGVPGPDGDFGYGGHCLPKDLNVIINIAKKHGSISNVLEATKATNDELRTDRDWEGMKGRAVL